VQVLDHRCVSPCLVHEISYSRFAFLLLSKEKRPRSKRRRTLMFGDAMPSIRSNHPIPDSPLPLLAVPLAARLSSRETRGFARSSFGDYALFRGQLLTCSRIIRKNSPPVRNADHSPRRPTRLGQKADAELPASQLGEANSVCTRAASWGSVSRSTAVIASALAAINMAVCPRSEIEAAANSREWPAISSPQIWM
jgi:hypothetical protein